MTSAPHAWLPAPALFDGVLAKLFGERLQDWSRTWLPAPIKVSSRQSAEGGRQRETVESLGTSCGGLQITADQSDRIRIASAMMGLRRPWSRTDRPDVDLLDGLALEALGDLIRKLAIAFRTNAEPKRIADRSGPPIAFHYGVSGLGGRLFDLSVGWEAAVAARKARIETARVLPPLGTRGEAIAKQAVAIGAFAGSGHVELAELRTLSLGDVLVLDRAIDDGFALTINGRCVSSQGLKLAQEGAALVLRSSRPERGGAS
jgi:hypothetical protein